MDFHFDLKKKNPVCFFIIVNLNAFGVALIRLMLFLLLF